MTRATALFARGIADDKGDVMAVIQALRDIREGGQHPVQAWSSL